jgi:predicted ATP-grasp superfamily ATP-dependent carboligase
MAARGSVLLLDGFWPKTLVAVRALAAAGERVVVGEQTRIAPALWSNCAAGRFLHPDPFFETEAFIRTLEAVVARESRRGPVVLLPMEEETLLVVLRARERLQAAGPAVALPFADVSFIETFRDKARFEELARRAGFATPRTRPFHDETELFAAARELGFPLVVKRRISSGARGVSYARDERELRRAGREALALDPTPLLQERLPREGEAIGVSLLLWRDAAGARPRLVAGFAHRRLREYPVSGGSSTLREAIRADALVESCAAFLADFGFVGVAMLEWKRDLRDGQLKLLECNPRFWGSLHQAVLSGVDFPALLVALARGETVETPAAYRLDRRSRALLPADLLHWWSVRPRPRLSEFLRRAPDEVDEALSAEDPAPILARLLGFVPLLIHPGLRRLALRPSPRVTSARC